MNPIEKEFRKNVKELASKMKNVTSAMKEVNKARKKVGLTSLTMPDSVHIINAMYTEEVPEENVDELTKIDLKYEQLDNFVFQTLDSEMSRLEAEMEEAGWNMSSARC